MMNCIIIRIILLVLTLPLVAESASQLTKEDNRITTAVESLYIKGLEIRDFSLIRKICIDETRLYSIRPDSSLNITTLDNWSKRFNPNSPPFKSLDYEILKVDFEGNAAQVKIKFIVDKKHVIHDFLNMLKINGEWRIVNIIDY